MGFFLLGFVTASAGTICFGFLSFIFIFFRPLHPGLRYYILATLTPVPMPTVWPTHNVAINWWNKQRQHTLFKNTAVLQWSEKFSFFSWVNDMFKKQVHKRERINKSVITNGHFAFLTWLLGTLVLFGCCPPKLGLTADVPNPDPVHQAEWGAPYMERGTLCGPVYFGPEARLPGGQGCYVQWLASRLGAADAAVLGRFDARTDSSAWVSVTLSFAWCFAMPVQCPLQWQNLWELCWCQSGSIVVQSSDTRLSRRSMMVCVVVELSSKATLNEDCAVRAMKSSSNRFDMWPFKTVSALLSGFWSSGGLTHSNSLVTSGSLQWSEGSWSSASSCCVEKYQEPTVPPCGNIVVEH